jgi:hypothetical protein
MTYDSIAERAEYDAYDSEGDTDFDFSIAMRYLSVHDDGSVIFDNPFD